MSGDPTKDEHSDASGGVEATRRRSAELFEQLRDDTTAEPNRDAAREGLVHLHLPLVEHCARRFRNRGGVVAQLREQLRTSPPGGLYPAGRVRVLVLRRVARHVNRSCQGLVPGTSTAWTG